MTWIRSSPLTDEDIGLAVAGGSAQNGLRSSIINAGGESRGRVDYGGYNAGSHPTTRARGSSRDLR